MERARETKRRCARVAYAREGRVHVLVEHHVDEHRDEDERVRPRPVRDELLHDRAHAPALLDHIEELGHREREEDRLEREGDYPAGEKV